MNISKIPEKNNKQNVKCTIIDLLESIALEEIAISNLLNSEALKIKAFVGEKLDFPFCTNIRKVIDFSKLTSDFLDKIIMKEWLLLSKLNKVIELSSSCVINKIDDIEDCNSCTRPLKRFCEEEKKES
jgi:hypothetical protein